MKNKKPYLSVILPTYNRGNILVDTIKGLLLQDYKDFELIVIDQTDNEQHGIDAQQKKSLTMDSRVRWYSAHPNSLTAARNVGINLSRGIVVMFLDDDIRIDRTLLSKHMLAHKEDGVIAVAGKVTQKGHPKTNHIVYFDKFGFQFGLFNSDGPGDCTTFPGGNVSIRREAALKAGQFDESFTGSAIREESEFAHRLARLGRIVYRPRANIMHLAVPYGGCRIHTHQYNNLEFYFNDFRFVFKTVNRNDIPKALILRYTRYCYAHRGISKILFRNILYALGLLIALKRLILPITIKMRVEAI